MTTSQPAIIPKLTTLTACIVCGGKVEPLIDLGNQYLTDFLDNPDSNHPKAPLKLMLCTSCWLTQLDQVVDRDALFRNYHYLSGVNATVREHLKSLAEEVRKRAKLKPGDVVVDIGSNDGTFLGNFPTQRLVGFEPSDAIESMGRTRKVFGVWNYIEESGGPEMTVIRDYFSTEQFERWIGAGRKTPLITSLAMFYDLLEPTKFAQDIAEVLAPDGLWVCEMNYLGDMLRKNAFDFIGHEHVAEYSLGAFQKAIAPAGLEVVDVSLNDLNGGSARYWVAYKGKRPVEKSVGNLLSQEVLWCHLGTFANFRDGVKTVVWELGRLIRSEVRAGKRVWAKGASTRGMTLLQTAELDNAWIEAISDANPLKHGKYVAGLNIPVRSNEEMRREQPENLLILPWSFAEQFIEQEAEYLRRGGRIIVPLPSVRTVTGK